MGQISIARGVVAIDPTSPPGGPLYTDVTSPRVLYSGTAGLISGSATFEWLNSSNALQIGTGGQYQIYNTADKTTNYERGVLKWDTNALIVGTEKGGTGTARTLNFQVDGTSRWYLNTTGHFLTVFDNTNDIGAVSSGRPRSVYVGTTLSVATTAELDSGATFNLYNTADKTTNFERLSCYWTGNVAAVIVQHGGSASPRELLLGVSGSGATYRFAAAQSATSGHTIGWGPNGSTGVQTAFNLTPTLNQSGTAGATILNVDPTVTATGSGTYLIQRWGWGGTQQAYLTSNGAFASFLTYSTGILMGATLGGADLILNRDGADILALRHGTNAQTFRVYNTYTDGSNYERGLVAFVSNAFVIRSEATGTGTARNMNVGPNGSGTALTFRSAGTDRWTVDPSGRLTTNADNAYDIGASGANRPRDIYIGNSLTAGNAVVATGVVRGQQLVMTDGITAPTATAGQAKLYVDTADGDLKIIFGDGTIKTIVTDT